VVKTPAPTTACVNTRANLQLIHHLKAHIMGLLFTVSPYDPVWYTLCTISWESTNG